MEFCQTVNLGAANSVPRSTEGQLHLTYSDVSARVGKGVVVDVVLLDFSKAFDVVCSSVLIAKLWCHGVSLIIVSFLHVYAVGALLSPKVTPLELRRWGRTEEPFAKHHVDAFFRKRRSLLRRLRPYSTGLQAQLSPLSRGLLLLLLVGDIEPNPGPPQYLCSVYGLGITRSTDQCLATYVTSGPTANAPAHCNSGSTQHGDRAEPAIALPPPCLLSRPGPLPCLLPLPYPLPPPSSHFSCFPSPLTASFIFSIFSLRFACPLSPGQTPSSSFTLSHTS